MLQEELTVFTKDRASSPIKEEVFGFRNDNYRPSVYRSIVQNSLGSVAIVINGEPIGSGTLIGDNLVLTCRHGVEGAFSKDGTIKEDWRVAVWFDMVTEDSQLQPVEAYDVEKLLLKGKQLQDQERLSIITSTMKELDFILLQLKKNPPEGKYPRPVSYTHLTLPTICSV